MLEVPTQNLYEPNRQHPAAIAFILLKYLRRIGRMLIPLLLIVFIQSEDKALGYTLGVAIVFLVFQMVYAILEYFRYTFFIEGEELIIETGVLGRKRMGIPFDRIQTINFEQNVLHQVLDVIQVNIDTAGSAKTELNIQALGRKQAEELRSFVLSQKARLVQEAEGEASETETTEKPGSSVITNHKEHLVFSLKISDLIRVGITENHLKTLGIILSTGLGLFQFVDWEDFYSYGWVAEVIGSLDSVYQTFNVLTFGLSLVFLLLASFLLTTVQTLLRYFDLRLWQTEKGFRLNAGLLQKREQAAAISKIQIIRWSTDPLKKIFGLFTVRLFQASSQEVQRKQAITIPGCYGPQRATIVQALIPEEDQENYESHSISAKIISRHVLYLGILPAIAMMLGTFSVIGALGALWLLWIPLVYLLSRRYQSNFRWFINEETLMIRNKLIATRHSLIAWRKVQAVEIKQSPYQQRQQLATVALHTAAGDVSIPYISLEQAHLLRDYVLYRVETDERAWM